MVPIAPELKPILLRLFNAAAEGAEIGIPRLRDARVNLRTQFEKIIGRAGATTWPGLFHNLRGSCATDWCERFPAHVVAGWLGHSPLTAAQHYLTTNDAHFSIAAGIGESGAESDARFAQNQAQQDSTGDRTESPEVSEVFADTDLARQAAESCDLLQ